MIPVSADNLVACMSCVDTSIRKIVLNSNDFTIISDDIIQRKPIYILELVDILFQYDIANVVIQYYDQRTNE